MLLYLVRHAHAGEAETDALRPLSADGRTQTDRLAEFLLSRNVPPPREFWHSSLLRAKQTAERLAAGWFQAPLTETADLKPESDPRRIAQRLDHAVLPLAVVGHEPHLSILASLLVTGRPVPVFAMEKAAFLALERSDFGGDPYWVVRWHVSPYLVG